MRLTETDAGRSVELRLGDELQVSLPANPTTGYQWEVNAVDDAILRPLGVPTFEPHGGAVGGGGKMIMRFEAVGSGPTVLKLIYRRPFEKDRSGARTFAVDVTVRPIMRSG